MCEEECTEFIATVPVVWDETIVLDGKVGEHIITARRKGTDWYIGGMTNWDDRLVEIDLSFLDGDTYRMELYKDGVNAGRVARDYKKENSIVTAGQNIMVRMAAGGGFALCLRPETN